MNYDIEFTPAEVVAKALHTTIRSVGKMILNGTLPIGSVVWPENDTDRLVVKILTIRWEAWINAQDLNGRPK